MAEIILNFRRVTVTDECEPDVKKVNLILGFQGEHGARPVKFRLNGMKEKWPNAEPALIAVRPEDGVQYIADGIEYNEETETLVWMPDIYDTEQSGDGTCQVQLMSLEGDVLAMSEVLTTIIRPSIYGTSNPALLPTWAEHVMENAKRVEDLVNSFGDVVEAGKQEVLEETGTQLNRIGDAGREAVELMQQKTAGEIAKIEEAAEEQIAKIRNLLATVR